MWIFILIAQINLTIKNPSFENWIDTTTPEDWSVNHPVALPVYKERNTVNNGNYSIKVERASKVTSFTDALEQFIPVDYQGLNYKIKFFVFDNDPDVRGRIYCTWCAQDSSSLNDYFFSSYSTDSPFWQELIAEEVAPSGAFWIKLTLRIYLQTGSTDSLGFIFYDNGIGLEINEKTKIDFTKSYEKKDKIFYDILGRRNEKARIIFLKGKENKKVLKIK
ncbi:MAG: hypothetical protein ABIN21_00600 [candidate division WOR-3 bacterium]